MLGDPEMTEHLGGPENPESVAQRQTGYEQENSRQYKIVEDATGAGVGWVGYWELKWRDEQIFEIWVVGASRVSGPGHREHGNAQAIELARNERMLRFLHAFPSVELGNRSRRSPARPVARRVRATWSKAAPCVPPGNTNDESGSSFEFEHRAPPPAFALDPQ